MIRPVVLTLFTAALAFAQSPVSTPAPRPIFDGRTLNGYLRDGVRGERDHDLEDAGRLTAPLRYDAATDKYVSVTWDEAFEDIGRELRALDPKRVALPMCCAMI